MSCKIAINSAGLSRYVAAVKAACKEADMTLIKKAHLGGTCMNHGSIPSKILGKGASSRPKNNFFFENDPSLWFSL